MEDHVTDPQIISILWAAARHPSPLQTSWQLLNRFLDIRVYLLPLLIQPQMTLTALIPQVSVTIHVPPAKNMGQGFEVRVSQKLRLQDIILYVVEGRYLSSPLNVASEIPVLDFIRCLLSGEVALGKS